MVRPVEDIDNFRSRYKALTDRERIVCMEYLKTFNQQKAYALGYPDASKKSVATNAARFFARPRIREYLKKHVNARVEETGVEFASIIDELIRIALFNPYSIMQVDEEGKPELNLMKIHNNPDVLRAVNIEFKQVPDGKGGLLPVYKVKPQDKLRAIELLLSYWHVSQPKTAQYREITVSVRQPDSL